MNTHAHHMTQATAAVIVARAAHVNAVRVRAARMWCANDTVIGMSFRTYKRPRPKEPLLR